MNIIFILKVSICLNSSAESARSDSSKIISL